MKKKSWVYKLIIFVWTVCSAFLVYNLYKNINNVFNNAVGFKEILITIFLIGNTLILMYMWFGSVKDFMFSFIFLINKKRILKRYEDIYNIEVNETPKFVLLYCTRNDFNEEALLKCMGQDYPNFEAVILDDSSKEEYFKRIDNFSKEHNVKVVRRENKVGFKAGNLNNYLQNNDDYDYFVVLDSDEIIPSDYCSKILKYFYYNKQIGAVQASHIATQGVNVFQDLMGLSVKSNGQTCQIMKNFYGSNSLIGHGMTISKECYKKTGGFPHVVAEDISFAIEIKNSGYKIAYAPNIVCQEEFPVNYICLKKRQCKWTQGNIEFMKKYNKSVNKSNMTWFEKLDTKLSHYNLPIMPMLSYLLLINTIGLGFCNYNVINYSFYLFGLMTLFLVSPLIPDLFVHAKSKNVFKLIPYFIVYISTYASLSPMMIKTVVLGVMGKKATFIVTPKENSKISLVETFKATYDTLLFMVIVGVLGYFACGSIVPLLFILITCALSPIMVLLANIAIKPKVIKTKQKIKVKKAKKSKVEKKSSTKFDVENEEDFVDDATILAKIEGNNI